jgi:hypothetical protein
MRGSDLSKYGIRRTQFQEKTIYLSYKNEEGEQLRTARHRSGAVEKFGKELRSALKNQAFYSPSAPFGMTAAGMTARARAEIPTP